MYLNSKSLYSSFLFLSKFCIKEEEKPCGKLQMITKSWGNTLTQLFKTQARIITAWALWGGLVLVGGLEQRVTTVLPTMAVMQAGLATHTGEISCCQLLYITVPSFNNIISYQ